MKEILKNGAKAFCTTVAIVAGLAVGCVAGDKICGKVRSNKNTETKDAEEVKAE